MKIIITEEQYRLIVESENKGRLMTIPGEMLTDKESFDKFYNLYQDNKDRKNYIGIKVIGALNLSGGRYGMRINSSVIKFCDELIEVNGYLRVVDNYAINLPKLKRVDDDITLSMTEIRELPELEYVGESMYLHNSGIKSLPMLKYVGSSLDLRNGSIESLPILEKVGNYLDLAGTKIKSLPMLEEVGGYLNLFANPIESLPRLKYVDGALNLKYTPLSKTTTEEELRNKINVGGEIYL
jgi:hypothetical protein